MNKLIAIFVGVLLIGTVASAALATSDSAIGEEDPELYFGYNYYDMDFWIYSEPHWLDEEIHWGTSKVKRSFSGDTLRMEFEDWLDNDYNDVIFEMTANKNLITVKKVSHDTAAPDPTTLKLIFEEGTFLRVVEEGRTYSGQEISIRLWDDIRTGGDTRTILIPKLRDGACDEGTYLLNGACAIGEVPEPQPEERELSMTYIDTWPSVLEADEKITIKFGYSSYAVTQAELEFDVKQNGQIVYERTLPIELKGYSGAAITMPQIPANTLEPDTDYVVHGEIRYVGDNIVDINSNNNEVSMEFSTVGVQPYTDLSIYKIYPRSYQNEVGDEVRFDIVLQNSGQEVQGDYEVKLKRSGSTEYINKDKRTVHFDANEQYEVNWMYDSEEMDLDAGLYVIEVVVDPDNKIDEIKETNNRLFSSFVLNEASQTHKLRVEDIEIVPNQPEQDDAIQIFADIRNLGTIEHVVYAQARLYDGNTELLRSSNSGRKLVPQNSISVFTMNLDLEQVDLLPGKDYQVDVHAFYEYNGELFESNNYYETFRLKEEAELPDIKVKSVSVTKPITTYSGGSAVTDYAGKYPSVSIPYRGYQITAELSTEGNTGTYTVHFYDNDKLFDTKVVTQDQTHVSSVIYRPTVGKHVMKVTADPLNVIAESNENNNKGTFELKVEEPEEDWRNRPYVSLKPLQQTVNSGETAKFQLVIRDNNKESRHKYELEINSPFKTNLPGFVTLKPGETKYIDFEMYTTEAENSVIQGNVKYDGGVNQIHFFSISVIPELQAYRQVVSARLIIRGETPPNPPTFPTTKYNIELDEGWNLVSVPGEFVTFSGSTCKSKKPVAFVYLDEEKEYVTVKEAQKELGRNFKAYMSGHSFWVYSFDECTLKVKQIPTTQDSIKLSEGWYFLPAKSSMVGNNLNEMASCISSAYEWRNQEWNTFSLTRDIRESDFGKGAVVRVNWACTLHTDESFSPPSLPQASIDEQAFEDD